MKTVLLLVFIDSHFVELARVARVMVTWSKYKPIIWFVDRYPALARDVEDCRLMGLEFVFSGSTTTSSRSRYWLLKDLILRLSRALYFTIFFVFGLVRYRSMINAFVEKTNALIRQYQPSLLIVCEENIGYLAHIPIRICRNVDIPTVVVPYTIANATEAAESYYDSNQHRVNANLINRMVARKYPHWVYVHRNRELLPIPAAMLLALEKSGYGSALPWKINSEGTGVIAVENEHMIDYYKNEGLPSERLMVTGALYDDVLAESTSRSVEMRRKLDEELGLQSGLPLLLCAMPPSQFPRECEFAEYDALLSFWMESLSGLKGWNVVLRPHPRLTDEEIGQIERFGLKVSKWDTASLVPLCDLYVASVSATIRWAIACGKPVVNYDVYQMKYADYKDVGGVITVFSKADFKEALIRLTTDSEYYKVVENNQRREMSKWGRLDGKASERMLKLFDDVVSGKIRIPSK